MSVIKQLYDAAKAAAEFGGYAMPPNVSKEIDEAIAAYEAEQAERALPVEWDWLLSKGGVEANQYVNSNDVRMLYWSGIHLCWKEQCRSSDGIHRAFVVGKSGYVGELDRGGFFDLKRVLESSK